MDAVALAPRMAYKYQVLVIVMIGTFMATLDSSIVNVSLPAIMADFASSVDDIQWVVTGYMLSFATLMPLTSWFRDHIGHKALYIASLGVFTAGSLLCGVAWNLPSLIVARLIQAMGGGALGPTGMAMISEAFEPKERGKALGYWGLGIIIGPAIGPTLGGFLTKTLGWRSIFMVNLPVGIAGVLLAMAWLVAEDSHLSRRRPFDFGGFLFLSLFLITFLLGLSKGEQEGWNSTYILTCFILSGVGFAGFFLVESIVPHGIIDLSLFKSPVFSTCMLVNAVRSVALFGPMFLLPVFMERIMGFDEILTGLILLPGALVMAVLIPPAGRMADRIGPRYPSLIGLLVITLFMYLYRNLGINTSIWGLIYPTMIRSCGFVLLMAPVLTAALNSVPRSKAGQVSSISNLLQQIAGAIGIALLTTVLSNRSHFHMSAFSSALSASPAIRGFVQNISTLAVGHGYSHAAAANVGGMFLARHVAETAQVAGFDDTFLFGAVLILVAVIPAFLLPKNVVLHHEAELKPLE